MKARFWISTIGATVLALSSAAPAAATTFCVPNFHAACPNNGTNVAQANLETAMQASGSDGIADAIVIDAGTFTDTDSFETHNTNSDALEIIGAGAGTGAGATRLTTSSSSNVNVVDLFPGSRVVTMRGLTIVIPGSIPAFQGGAVQTRPGDALQNVDVESQGAAHQTGTFFVGAGSYDGGSLYGTGGGSLQRAIETNPAISGAVDLRRLTITRPETGVSAKYASNPVSLRRSRIDTPSAQGVGVSGSGTATVENVVITDPGLDGIGVGSNSASSPSATVRHTTIARISGSTTANPLSAVVVPVNGYGDASLTATGTIIRGFDNSYYRQASTDTMIGDANLSLSYSNFAPAGVSTGDGALTLGPGNINADPLFAGPSDFHLLAGSPSIDAADPMPAVAVGEDFDGAPRPVDGNGDCAARPDMGAYELQLPPPAACLPPAPAPPATQATPLTTPVAPVRKCKKRKVGSRAAPAAKRKCRRKKG